MNKPHPDAPDQQAGRSALGDLKREAAATKILVDPGKAAADARQAASQRKVAAVQLHRERIGELRRSFIELNRLLTATSRHRVRLDVANRRHPVPGDEAARPTAPVLRDCARNTGAGAVTRRSGLSAGSHQAVVGGGQGTDVGDGHPEAGAVHADRYRG